MVRGAKNTANCLPIITPGSPVLPVQGKRKNLPFVSWFLLHSCPFPILNLCPSGSQEYSQAYLPSLPSPLTLILQYVFYVDGDFPVCSVCSLIAFTPAFLVFLLLDCKLLKGKVSISAKLCKHHECAVNSIGTQ